MDKEREAARLDSIPFIKGRFAKSQPRHLELAIENTTFDGPWLEFGVWKGTTARLLIDRLPWGGRLSLFDSFQGLPEDWKDGFPKGRFLLPESQRPRFSDRRVELVEGFFEEALPDWARTRSEPAAFLFIDCDLYSSTRTVLFNLHHLIVPGTVIVFDEFFVPELEKDEMSALLEYAREYDVEYDYLARAQNGSVSLVVSRSGGRPPALAT